jgi:hypothetical protein
MDLVWWRQVAIEWGAGRGLSLRRNHQLVVAFSTDSGLEAFSHNPTHGSFAALPFQATAFTSIGRADIEESKSNVAMNAWLPQASYPERERREEGERGRERW